MGHSGCRAKTIVEFAGGLSLADYLKDKKLQLAVERELEIIGEVAKRLSDIFKLAHPEVQWSRIIAQRNVLAHEYGDIKQGQGVLRSKRSYPGID